MDCWFTTSHGETLHNDPSTKNYVPGEPPLGTKKIDYREFCLKNGFARVGWPNTGDLRPDHLGEGRLAKDGYTLSTIGELHKSYLIKFSHIRAGDLVIIPAKAGRNVVHLGIVLTKDKKMVSPDLFYNTKKDERDFAYYYFHDIPNGDYYECAHRVNVKWALEKNGDFAEIELKNLGGIWLKAFSRVVKEKEKLCQKAKYFKLY